AAAMARSHSRRYRSANPVRSASSAAVAGPPAPSSTNNPNRSPISASGKMTAAPASVITCPSSRSNASGSTACAAAVIVDLLRVPSASPVITGREPRVPTWAATCTPPESYISRTSITGLRDLPHREWLDERINLQLKSRWRTERRHALDPVRYHSAPGQHGARRPGLCRGHGGACGISLGRRPGVGSADECLQLHLDRVLGLGQEGQEVALGLDL